MKEVRVDRLSPFHCSGARMGMRLGQIDSRALILMAVVVSGGMAAASWILASANHRASPSQVQRDVLPGSSSGDSLEAPRAATESEVRSVDALYAVISRPDFSPAGFVEDQASATAADALSQRRKFPPIPAGSTLLAAMRSVASSAGVELVAAPDIAFALSQGVTTREFRPSTGWHAMDDLLRQAKSQLAEEYDELVADLEGDALAVVPRYASPRTTVVYDVLDLCVPKLGVHRVPERNSEQFWLVLGGNVDEVRQLMFDSVDGDWAELGKGTGQDTAHHLPEAKLVVIAQRRTHRLLQRFLNQLRAADSREMPREAP